MSEVGLFLRTMRHLNPSQVAHRARLRVQRSRTARDPQRHARRLQTPVARWAGMPDGFAALDRIWQQGSPSPEANAAGWFDLLHQPRDLGQPICWTPSWVPQLWRFHLHYFEWAFAFATHPDDQWARTAFADMWRSWSSATVFGRWDEWSPYVASLRVWVLCDVFATLVAGGRLEREIASSIALHARYIEANLELDLGGNHLIKNAKALIGAGVFLGDDALVASGCRHLERQLGVQVLADGGHYERSPSYHAQVLGDLIDVRNVLAASQRPPIAQLDTSIDAMRGWLAAMVHPDGDVPMFNDSELLGGLHLDALAIPALEPQALRVLEDSGYAVLRPDERLSVVMDFGDPCPDELPGHAHADCLSVELCVDGTRVFINSGTSTYEPGERRHYERSTAAHNTIQIDDTDQTEVWGTFRAAFRARGRLERRDVAAGRASVVASHRGYRRLKGRITHRRQIDADPGRIRLRDELEGSGEHTITWSLHVAPGIDVVQHEPNLISVGPVDVTVSSSTGEPVFVKIEPALLATGFNDMAWGTVLRIDTAAELPLTLITLITVRDDA